MKNIHFTRTVTTEQKCKSKTILKELNEIKKHVATDKMTKFKLIRILHRINWGCVVFVCSCLIFISTFLYFILI